MFAPNDYLKAVNISISDDSRLESTESFMVLLAPPSIDQIGLQIREPGMATVTITDDDSKNKIYCVCISIHTTYHFAYLMLLTCIYSYRCYSGV